MTPRRLPLHEWHAEHAVMFEFAGFEMPLEYKGFGPTVEALSVRRNVGLFDVSHMGRIMVSGDDATRLMNLLFTRDVEAMRKGDCKYGFLLNEHGGIIDDIIVYKMDNGLLLVVNACNRERAFSWITAKTDEFNFNVQVDDLSDESVMFAVQGPLSPQVIKGLTSLSSLGRFKHCSVTVLGSPCLLSRTGYTGEDGFEIIQFDDEKALALWELILKLGESSSITPCGLAARDILRMEAGLALYGVDINEDVTPIEASLERFLDLDKNFIGRKALETRGIRFLRVSLLMEERGIPRKGYSILIDGMKSGFVTSGTLSPLKGVGVGMGYIKKNSVKHYGYVEIRGKPRKVRILHPSEILTELKSLQR
ncbi:MAG: glycine cleavage system aminomethyltransferase GcvT [Candidatus Freyarchaeota archaeon]|nr:glycine cleavage system aminomethyltransferase GcvT [Candidatus Freyrarchaeum guaymaensis]